MLCLKQPIFSQYSSISQLLSCSPNIPKPGCKQGTEDNQRCQHEHQPDCLPADAVTPWLIKYPLTIFNESSKLETPLVKFNFNISRKTWQNHFKDDAASNDTISRST